MDFLQYIEHDAENLQFYLWFRDYVKRFASLPESEARLAPEWTPEQARAEAIAEKERGPVSKKMPAETAAVFKGTDFEPQAKIVAPDASTPNPFNTPPRTPSHNGRDVSTPPSTVGWTEDVSTEVNSNMTHAKKAAQAFEEVNALQPCKLSRCHTANVVLTLVSYCSTFQRGDLQNYCYICC